MQCKRLLSRERSHNFAEGRAGDRSDVAPSPRRGIRSTLPPVSDPPPPQSSDGVEPASPAATGTKIYLAGHTLDSDHRDVDTAITRDHPGGTAYYWSLEQ